MHDEPGAPLVRVTVARLGLDSSSNSFVVVLQEADGERILPIWIGRNEAESIAAHLQGVRRERPMTHDLIRGLFQTLDVTLVHVAITSVHDSTFFAELQLDLNGKRFMEDARPSDAIAIAVRCGVNVYVDDALLLEPTADERAAADLPIDATLDPSVDDDDETEDDLPLSFLEPTDDPLLRPPVTEPPAEALQRYLASLRPEDFGKFRP